MSSELWALLHVTQPPNVTCKITVGDTDLAPLVEVCTSAVSTLENQEVLYLEAATLSRLIYRMKTVFRSDKGLKCMEKVNRCLRNFLHMNILPVYRNFLSSLPRNVSKCEVFCPTLQMLQYVLVRTQSLGALLCRTVHTCSEAATFIQGRITTGHSWSLAVTSLCVISRIWSICRHLLECCVKWYSAMIPFCNVLQPKGVSWLPTGYQFPEDLRFWLSISSFIDTPKDSEMRHLIGSGGNHPVPVESFQSLPIKPVILDDIGEAVPRSEIPLLNFQTFSPHKKNTNLSQESLTEGYFSNINLPNKVLQKKSSSRKTNLPVNSAAVDYSSQHKNVLDNKTSFKEACDGANSAADYQEKASVVEDGFEAHVSRRMTAAQGSHIKPGKFNSKTKRTACSSVLQHDYISQKISSLKTEKRIRIFLDQENKKRHITASLEEQQWNILHPWLQKQYLKLKKAQELEKKTQIVDKIKTVLTKSLT